MQIKLQSDNYHVLLNTLGAELNSYSNPSGNEYVWNSDPAYWLRSSPLLFPTVGNVRNGETVIKDHIYQMPKHGFCKESEFEVTEQTENSVTFLLKANEETLKHYIEIADSLGLSALVEAHDEEEIQMALRAKARIIGINNRNLRTFETSIEQTLKLKRLIPQDRLFVTESGIRTQEDVQRLRHAGVGAFLVGEAFMREISPGAALQELFGDS